jgi:hypothetical protein
MWISHKAMHSVTRNRLSEATAVVESFVLTNPTAISSELTVTYPERNSRQLY